MSPTRRWPTAVLAFALAAAACGGDDDDGDDAPRPLVADIAPAVDALEAQLGGPQEYFELNATALGITLWVAEDDATTAVPYLSVGEEIATNGDPQNATGETFTAAQALTFDPDDVLDHVADDLADSTLASFSIIGGAGSTVQFDVLVQSAVGGEFSVQVDGNGDVIATDTPLPPTLSTQPPVDD